MKTKRRTLWGILALAGTLLVGLILFWNLRAGDAYSLDILYAALPASDDALVQLLRHHAGYRDARVSRVGTRISVQLDTYEPSSPATLRYVLQRCDSLGYRGRVHYTATMTNRSQRGTTWHTFWVEYSQLPPDDTAFTSWLARQPGISQPTAWRDGQTLVLQFDIGSTAPPTILADILKAGEQFGYRGETGNLSAFGRYK